MASDTRGGVAAPAAPNELSATHKLRNIRNALYTEQLRESLQTLLDLCAIGDVDENTEAHGWGDAIKRAKALLEADAPIAGVTPCCPPGEPHAFDCPNGVERTS